MKSRSGGGGNKNKTKDDASQKNYQNHNNNVVVLHRRYSSKEAVSANTLNPSQHHHRRRRCWCTIISWSSVFVLMVISGFALMVTITNSSLLFRILNHIQQSTSLAELTDVTTSMMLEDDGILLLEKEIMETKTALLSNSSTQERTIKKVNPTTGAAIKTTKKATAATKKKTTTAKKKMTTETTKKEKEEMEKKKKKTTTTTTTSATTTTTTTTTSATTTITTKPAIIITTADLSPVTFAIRYRGPKSNATTTAELTKKWGRWSQLRDSKGPRPALPCEQYSHCDVPRDKFPPNAWQSDPVFLKTFLKQAQELVTRAQEAILAEYGRSKYDLPNMTLAQRSKNFQLSRISLTGKKLPPDPKKVAIDNGGWTTSRSFQGLVRRILHAIMTQDSFTFALGGHSAAAGHGNLFKQSYALQFHRVMEPVFGRLGVQLYSYNFGKGGRGTSQDSMGMSTLWGKEIDFCMWDAGMLELTKPPFDLFARQALIGGNRVPILWNGYVDILKQLHNQADVDIGGHGSGLLGLPLTESEEHAKKLPHALRYLKCTRKRNDLCDANKYNANCWVNRPDVIPPTKQHSRAGGQLTQHPGFRMHQLTSRVLAFTMLLALQEGLSKWAKAPNYKLADSAWHVTAHYNNIRTKLAKVTNTPCFSDSTIIPTPRLCTTPMKGVSEYLPRAYPETNSIRSIVTNASFINKPTPNLYSGPDVYNPALEPPQGEVNYLAIMENDDGPINLTRRHSSVTTNLGESNGSPLKESSLTIGRGWSLRIESDDLPCNGTYDSECARNPRSVCLLEGHNDGKGGLVFDSFSGWLLMRLKDFKNGLILIKMETWQHTNRPAFWPGPESSELTEGWTEENNGLDKLEVGKSSEPRIIKGISSSASTPRRRRRLLDQKTLPSNVAPELCPEFRFEYAINGHIQAFNKTEFFRRRTFVQKLVETWTLLDDPKFTTTSGKTTDLDFGIRMQGCKRNNTLKLTHVYWS